ncbi:unnamed protein product [Closterium sp. Naga37s-1]|nr:unnamed protein product [Closterium sp. Naga37s-1]
MNICGSKTCIPVRVCAMSAANPFQVGTCLDDGAGGYNCLCPAGFVADERPDETPVCVPELNRLKACVRAWVLKACVIAWVLKACVRAWVLKACVRAWVLMAWINLIVGEQMLLGQQVCVRGGKSSLLLGATRCVTNLQYTVVTGDTCARTIALYFKSSSQLLAQYNTGYVCTNSRLYKGMRLCKPP